MTILLPIDAIEDALTVAKNAIANQKRISEAVHALGTEEDVRKYAGENGVQERQKELERAEYNCKAIIAHAQERIEGLRKKAVEAVEAQTDPSGEDVHDPDYALFDAGLIESPEKLRRLLEKHDTPAFCIRAERYAAAHDWEGFEYILKTQGVQDYLAQVFDGLATAAARPTGYSALQYTAQAGELRRIAEAHGIADIYDKSGGRRLDGLFIR